TDVAEPYGKTVFLGDTPEQFVRACEQALQIDSRDRTQRVRKMRQVLARTSWDRTAEAMDELLADAVTQRRKGRSSRIDPAAFAKAEKPSVEPSSTPPVLVIGGGPTGLSAAYHLGEDALLLEQNDTIG